MKRRNKASSRENIILTVLTLSALAGIILAALAFTVPLW